MGGVGGDLDVVPQSSIPPLPKPSKQETRTLLGESWKGDECTTLATHCPFRPSHTHWDHRCTGPQLFKGVRYTKGIYLPAGQGCTSPTSCPSSAVLWPH